MRRRLWVRVWIRRLRFILWVLLRRVLRRLWWLRMGRGGLLFQLSEHVLRGILLLVPLVVLLRSCRRSPGIQRACSG